MGGSNSYLLDLALMFTAGAGAISMMATANTTLQLAVPDELRGRVMSVYTTVFAGTSPIGGIAWYRALRASGQIPARVASTRSVAVPSGSLGPPGPAGAAPVSTVRPIQ